MANNRIMIVAGEASGDLHGANLVKSLKQLQPGLSICGMGGKNLRSQGVEILCDAEKVAVVGLLEVFSHLADIRKAMRVLEDRMRKQPPDLLVLIDFPDFNLMLAKKAKLLHIPVLYYISPQVWAWRGGRVNKIGRLADRIAVILPFEKDFYRERGVTVDFVGHPLLDSVKATTPKNDFLKQQHVPENATIIGLLPGSRRKEIAAILPIFLDAAQSLADCYENLVFLLPLAFTLTIADLQENGIADCGLNIKIVPGDERYEAMAACDVVMAASGTVTLELAILNVPMVVSYRMSPITHFLGKRLIKVQYASLVNLVADSVVVPEFLQQNAMPENICRGLREILDNRERNDTMRKQLQEVCCQLGGPGASDRTAQIALDMINNQTSTKRKEI